MVVLVLLLALAAAVLSMFGMGGGVLYTPIQVWYGVDFHSAATNSLFLIMITSLSASLVYRKANRVDWGLAGAMETFTVVGGFLGGWWSERISGAGLTMAFAFVVAVSAVLMIADWKRRTKALSAGEKTHWLFGWKRTMGDQVYIINLALALPVSFVAGLTSGLVGIGGGLIKVPVMVLLLGVPMEIAVGSSAFMVGLTAAGGFAGHVVNGHWDWKTSCLLAVGVFVGAQIGGRLSVRTNSRKLQLAFGWFLLIVAASMIVKAFLHG